MLWRMVKELLSETWGTWVGVAMGVAAIAVGLVFGLISSGLVTITDQQQANITAVTGIGGVVGLVVYMFFVAPFRLWYKAKRDLEKCQQEEKGAPLAVHHGKGNQIINNFIGLDATQMEAVISSATSGGPTGVALYAPASSSQTLVVPSHRPRHVEVSTPQLSLPLPPPPSEPHQLEPEDPEGPEGPNR
jgi:hypothetical protein